jgi:hypothetical protein
MPRATEPSPPEAAKPARKAKVAPPKEAAKVAPPKEGLKNEYVESYGTKGGVLASVDDAGILNLAIEKKPGTPSGSAMYQQALKAIGGPSRLKGIRGTWNTSMPDNLNSFNANIRKGMSPEAAARATFTGKMADKSGFGTATVESLVGEPGTFTSVKVLFTR